MRSVWISMYVYLHNSHICPCLSQSCKNVTSRGHTFRSTNLALNSDSILSAFHNLNIPDLFGEGCIIHPAQDNSIYKVMGDWVRRFHDHWTRPIRRNFMIPRDAGTGGGGAVGATCPHNFEAVRTPPPNFELWKSFIFIFVCFCTWTWVSIQK